MGDDKSAVDTVDPNSIEGILARIKNSGITWLVATIIGVTIVGALNAKGLFDDVAAIKLSESKFETSQAQVNKDQGEVNKNLLDSIAEQKVFNQRLSDREDAQDRAIQSLMQMQRGK